MELVQLLVGSLVRLLVGKSYHTKLKDVYSLPTNSLTNNRINSIWSSFGNFPNRILKPSLCFVRYDLPTNSLTNDPTNNCTNWIWMSKKIGL